MKNDFKALIVVGRPANHRVADPNLGHINRAVAYAFEAFATALAFMQRTPVETVVIEFSVETETLDFYDALKILKVPVVFSANRLEPSQFAQFGIRSSDVVFPERLKPSDSFADYRARPGIRGSASNISRISSSALFDA